MITITQMIPTEFTRVKVFYAGWTVRMFATAMHSIRLLPYQQLEQMSIQSANHLQYQHPAK